LPAARRVAHGSQLEEVALATFLHVQDPGRHDGVHDFDGEADGAVELVRDAGLHSARVRVHEAGAGVALGELLHHEVGHDSTMRKSGVQSIIVAKAEVVDADIALGAGGEDAVYAAELAGFGGGRQVRHEVHYESHAGVVVDGHFLVDPFLRLVAALEGHVAGSQEEGVDEGFADAQVGADSVDIADEGDVLLDEEGFAFGVYFVEVGDDAVGFFLSSGGFGVSGVGQRDEECSRLTFRLCKCEASRSV
jgi:hypothetical protein